jgi:hypothetical protein
MVLLRQLERVLLGPLIGLSNGGSDLEETNKWKLPKEIF